MMTNRNSTTTLISQALAEDLGEAGDVTSQAVFEKSDTATAVIKSKDCGILSGTRLLEPLFHSLSESLIVGVVAESGVAIEKGMRICELRGSVRAILAGERVALNFLQRLSGIATATHFLSSKIAHTNAKLLDTRKTTPLLRQLEKEAVVHGGGYNHRFGLYDMILIKDTHVKAAGGVAIAIRKAQSFVKEQGAVMAIEAETQTVAEFQEALACAPQRIMLDNMSIPDMAACVSIAHRAHSRVELEASGNVSESTIIAIAETGVDFISVGSITHSVKALDIHLVIE
jgi:nicotinate-nucleotide pyrophosphorylase (carboxylating)